MIQCRGHLGLALEPLDDGRSQCQLGRQHLERHRPAQLQLDRAEDHAHPASPNLTLDVVVVGELDPRELQQRVGFRVGAIRCPAGPRPPDVPGVNRSPDAGAGPSGRELRGS